MITTILLMIIYFALLKKFNTVFKNYELLLQNRSSDGYFIDYCDEPICFR